ncbi:MAG: dihydrolipoyl dehydrogenase [Terriglobia bacterium]
MAETYDVAIIGSGPGGYGAAFRAVKYGLKTALIEKDAKFGGTCLHVGCIPTKALLFQAEVYESFKRAQEFGIACKGFSLDWAQMQARKQQIVDRHATGLAALMKKNKVTTLAGFGRLKGAGSIEVSGGGPGKAGASKKTEVRAKNIILATGSTPRLLPGLEEDGERILTNNSVLELKKVPKSMVVIGAGAVGVEFASIYNTFGTEVTILEMLPRAVPLEDEEISAALEKAFKRRGIRVETEAKVESVKKTAKGASVTYRDTQGKPQTATAETVLVAVGRKPNTEGIGLEKTKAKVERGFVHVNEWMETAEPGLYAIGDIVAGLPQLAHAATWEGFAAVAKIAGKNATPVRNDRIPNCTYCEPQVASVGLTEKQARKAGYQVKAGKFPFLANSKASILGQHQGFIKVVAEEKYGELLGVHIIGPLATEVIAEAVAALQLEATVDDLMALVHAHPTLWEAMADAVGSLRGLTTNI